MSIKGGQRITANQYAKLRGRSSGWVTQQIKLGLPARGGKGRGGSIYQVDPAEAFEWELARAKQAAKPTKGERERLAAEQADKFALENATRRGELIEAEQVQSTVTEAVVKLAGMLDGIAGRVANEVAGVHEPARVRDIILRELRVARTQYAESLAELAESIVDSGDGGRPDPPAKKAVAKRVGKRKPASAARKRGTRAVAK